MNKRPPKRGQDRPGEPKMMARGTRSWRAELRRRADPVEPLIPQAIGVSDEQDAAALFHELHLHQLELELQNEDLRRAQQDSENALARFLELYHFTPIAYVSLDRMGVVLEANRAAARLIGLPGDQLLLSKLWYLVGRADEPVLERHLDDTFADDGPRKAVVRLRRGDGEERTVRLESVFVGDRHGAESRCRTAIVDITDLVHRETATRRLAAAVAEADDAVFVLDFSGLILSWNRGARELFGLAEIDAIGVSFTGLIPAERHDAFADLLDRLAHGERILSIDAQRLASDGRPLLVSMTAFPMRDEAGRPEAACFTERDVTARRKAEAEQAAREIRLRAVMEAAADGIIVADERGLIEEVNPAAEKMFGRSAAEAQGTCLFTLLQPAATAAPAVGRADLPAVLGLTGTVSGQRPDGSSFPVQVSVAESRIAGRVLYCCFVRAVQ